MTGSVTSLPVLIFHPACTPREKEAQFQLTCNLCRDSHKTQVWLCFLILSFLSTCTAATSVSEDLQTCLNELKGKFEKSDAMLYAPSVSDIQGNCKNMGLICYMLELMVVISEEEITDNKADCIIHYNATLHPEVDCPPCEIYPLENITVFLNRLNTILQEIKTSNIKK